MSAVDGMVGALAGPGPFMAMLQVVQAVRACCRGGDAHWDEAAVADRLRAEVARLELRDTEFVYVRARVVAHGGLEVVLHRRGEALDRRVQFPPVSGAA